MDQHAELMSQKEKDYIAFCFNRSFKSLKTDIDYGLIFAGKKIEYDFKQDKKEIKTIFGKHHKRSRKYFRVSANTETSFLENSLLICQFFEIFTILKYVELDAQTSADIESNILSYFSEYFEVLGNSSKMYALLGDAMTILSSDSQERIMRLFFTKSDIIKDADLLFEFLDKNMQRLPANDSFIHPNLWRTNSGCLLGLFLILKNEKHLDAIFNSFIASETVDCKYLHKLSEVLESLCNDQKKAEIRKKVLDTKTLEVKRGVNDLSLDK